MTIIDLSHRICDGMPVYPGDVQTRLVQERFLSRDYYNGYTLHTALHAGTHVDAPMHLLDKDQRPIAELPLERFCGPGFLLDGLDEEKTARFLTMLSDLGHASPIEHASFTFGIEGVSRTLLAQITRHRIASFSVQSQRYVRLDDFRYVIPPEIEAIPEAKAAFIESMNEDAQRYLDLVQKLEDGHTARLMAEGMPEKQARAKASKQANEDARFVLPNACETKMVVTMNARSLQNFFHLRCCSRAQWEIRALAEEMLRLVYPVAPHLFAKAGPACVSGPCPEGKMCCGRTAEVRARYAALKGEPQNG